MADRYDALKPGQVASTVRSMPRRYRAALSAIDPENTAVVTEAETAVHQAVIHLEAVDAALRRTINGESPTVSLSPTNPNGGGNLRSSLTRLDEAVESIASTIDQTPAADWTRKANLESGGSTDAESVARVAARVSAEALRKVETLAR